MSYKKFIASALALAVAAVMTGCGDKSSSSEPETTTETATEAEDTTVEATEEETTEPEPPKPAEASDPNTVTFDDGDCYFASAKVGETDAAVGEVSVEEVMGNKMLKFTDSGTSCADGLVQKVEINAAALIGTENLPLVRSIEMDVYADATAANLSTDDADNVKAPGWIGGGGGTNLADDKWYQFDEFSGGEYNFEMSGPTHVTFKFLLAAGGQIWSDTQTNASFLVMRWGMANEGNFYIDNIVFYDENGSSIPLQYNPLADGDAESAAAENEEAADAPAEETTAAPAKDAAADSTEGSAE